MHPPIQPGHGTGASRVDRAIPISSPPTSNQKQRQPEGPKNPRMLRPGPVTPEPLSAVSFRPARSSWFASPSPSSPITASPRPPRLPILAPSASVSETASFTTPPALPVSSFELELEEPSSVPCSRFSSRGYRIPRFEAHRPAFSSADRSSAAQSSSRSLPRSRNSSSWLPPAILRPPSVRLANPVNHVPRATPIAVPHHPPQVSDENLPLEAYRDAYPLLSIPEQRRNRLTPSPNSLAVEHSQGEIESGRSSIAVPRGQRRSGAFDDRWLSQEMSDPTGRNESREASGLRPPDRAHLGLDLSGPRGPYDDERPRHVRSQTSLRSQSQIAPVPSNNAPPASGEPEVAEELAWGPAHPCFPHINSHVPIGSNEFMTTRLIRIRRDWMVKGDLAPTFSNLYPEILDPLLPEQEFRKVIATVNDELIKAFDPFSFRNWLDGALGLLTGWLWEDIGAPAIKGHLRRVEDWIEKWNREVGAKDGVHIWSLRRTAYMSLDIQIPDPKVGIIHSEGGTSIPGTRPSSGV